MKADVAIITALGKELDAILIQGKEQYGLGWKMIKSQRSKRIYHQAVNKMQRRIVAVQAHGMGQLNAAIVTNDVITDFSPKVILLVGIAAGIADEVQLGDIVVSGQVIDYELGKLTEGGFRPNHPTYQSNSGVLYELKEYRAEEWKQKIMSSRPDGRTDRTPRVHVGDIFCGNKVVANQQVVSDLKKHFRGVIALEMESAGIAALLNQRESPPHFAMIKAICDRADGTKDDRWQQYAADAAAAFTLSFLESFELDVGSFDYHIASQAEIDEQVGHVIEFVAPDLTTLQDFQKELVEKVVTAGLKEVDDVLSGRYQADVGLGRHFLLRAGPCSEKRRESTQPAWIRCLRSGPIPTTRPKRASISGTRRRIRQGHAVVRLFRRGYSAPGIAKCSMPIGRSYDHVFLCSMPYYQTLLRDLIPPGGSVDHVLNQELAVLGYGNDPSSTHHLFAELDSRSLSYQQIGLDEPGKLSYRAFINLFEQWQRIPPARFGPKRIASVALREHRMSMSSSLGRRFSTLFNRARPGRDPHGVLPRRSTQRGLAAGVTGRHQKTAECHIARRTIDDGQVRHQANLDRSQDMRNQQVRDKLYNGLISTTPQDAEPYVLIMRFDTEEALIRFYTDREHSLIRRKVFERLDPRIKILYDCRQHRPCWGKRHGGDL